MDDIDSYLFNMGEENVAPTYLDVPTFDLSSITNYLPDFNVSDYFSNTFTAPDLSGYWDTATDPLFSSTLGSLSNNISVEDILGRNQDAFTTQVGLNPSISGDGTAGINLNKLSSTGELNDVAAGGKLSVEDAAKLGRYDLAGTIITPQELVSLAKDAGFSEEEVAKGAFKLTPIASDVVSPKAAQAAADFGLSSSGYASGLVNPLTIGDVNAANKAVTGSGALSATGAIAPKGGTNTNTIKDTITKILGGGGGAEGMDLAKIMALLAGLMSLKNRGSGVSPVGYTGKSTPLTASRQALTPGGEPGAGGKRFMTDVTYAAEGGLMDIVDGQPNQNVTFMAGGGLADYMKMGRGMNVGDLRRADYLVRTGMSPDDAAKYYGQVPEGMAKGGISDLGSYSDGGRMLKGPGDGMSDDIPATISGKRPARLADGEFVVPADVVSHLGNGSTDAGADVLYDMMSKVRKARTGTQKQGKQINPGKFVPRN